VTGSSRRHRQADVRRPRWRPASLRGRVTLTVLGLLALLLVVLFAVVDVALGARLRADLRTRLTDRVALARQLDSSLTPQQLVDHLRGEGVTAQLCAAGGGCVFADPTPAPPTAGTPPKPKAAKHARAAVHQSGSLLFVQAPLTDGQQLTLSTDGSAIPATLSRLVALEAAGGAAALAVAGLLLGRLVGAALHPLDEMTALARRIADGDRGRRLRTGRTDTELGRTAAAFDAMLDELETALAAARAAETAMRGFLSDASHELRTPLAALQATVENVLRTNPDRPLREAALAAAVRETSRAARLVEDLLTAARLSEPVPLQRSPVDLTELARAEVHRIRLLASQLTITLVGDEQLPAVADPARVGQILANLLDNARHATPPGGTITVTVGYDDGQPTIDVADSGAGIPPAERERIFDRLVRLDTARSRATGGAGLGLPIARALARAHGGDLRYVPDPTAPGARFRLTLPASPPAESDTAPRDETPVAAGAAAPAASPATAVPAP